MRVQLDCYTKEEYGVQLDTSGEYPVVEGKDRVLFLFVCYALRQLRNNEGHMVGDALAGLLDHDALEVLHGTEPLPSAAQLLSRKRKSDLMARGMSEREVNAEIFSMVFQAGLQPDPKMGILDKEFLSHVPSMKAKVYQGDAKKQFVLRLPPLNFAMKGFGGLFGDVRYHAFMSTLALMAFVFMEQATNTDFHMRLNGVAASCARAYFSAKLPIDQASLAARIVSDCG